MRLRALPSLLFLIAQGCDGDQLNPVGQDGGGDVATGDAATDAPPGDAGSDRGEAPDAFAACVFDTVYLYWDDGGLKAFEDRMGLSPPRGYERARTGFGGTPVGPMCSAELGTCGESASIDAGDLMDAISHPDVVAALGETQPPVFGRDSRPSDGTMFAFQRADRRGFFAGGPCAGASGCREVPPGVAALRDLLRRLDSQMAARPECAAFMP